MDLEEKLKEHFGYNEFRPHQKEIISACLDGRDVLAILPTGAGKSVCYQLPAMMRSGTAIVISPLISLMQDQVVSLSKSGLPAAFINSTLYADEIHATMDRLSEFKLLYIAPERFSVPEFVEKLKAADISLFAIDEAHCISQWGHAFRPEYRKLSFLKEAFPKTPVMALTATATHDVEKDIAAQLAMRNPFTVRASFDRPNLTLRVQQRKDADAQLLSFLQKRAGEQGIIYAATRGSVEETHEMLVAKKFKAVKYHAGLSDRERSQSQHDFIYGDAEICVATVAFGMGIHKPDIRYIVHLDMPRSIEQYYQEVGRAGRDGLPSDCLMLYSFKEMKVYDLFLEQIADAKVREMTRAKTEKMRDFCQAKACRRKQLLAYFGESYQPPCDSCDRCLEEEDLQDETVNAQKILSCVYRLQERFGVRYLIDVLRGMKAKGIMDNRHDSLSTYGLLRDMPEEELRWRVEALIDRGYLERTAGDYPVLRWTPISRAAARGEVKVMLPKRVAKPLPKKKKQVGDGLPYDRHLFDQLSAVRRKFAKEAEVPAFVVFSDRTLMEMSRSQPKSREEMLEISGVSTGKWEKYGKEFLEAILLYLK